MTNHRLCSVLVAPRTDAQPRAGDGYGFDEAKDGDGLTSHFTHAASGLDELVDGLSRLVRDSVI